MMVWCGGRTIWIASRRRRRYPEPNKGDRKAQILWNQHSVGWVVAKMTKIAALP